VLSLERIAGIDGQHGLDMQSSPIPEFEQPHAVIGAVVPATFMTGALLERADGCFQGKRSAMVGSSRKLPPGRRRKVGFMSERSCIMSIRLPLGRSLYRRKERDEVEPERPGLSVEMTKRVAAVGGTSSTVVRVAVYLPCAGNRRNLRVAKTFVPSVLSMLAVSGPPLVPSDFA